MSTEFTYRHRDELDEYPKEPALNESTAQALDNLTDLTDFNHDDVDALRNLTAAIYQSNQERATRLDPYIDHDAVTASNELYTRTEELYQHYLDNGTIYREHEREQWSQILKLAINNLDDYNRDDVRQLADKLDHPQDPTELLKQIWKPDNTVIIGPTDHTIDTVTTDIPFLSNYPTIVDEAILSDIQGKHVIGSIPEDLEKHAASVTRYSIRQKITDPSEWTLADYQNPPQQERELITYRADPYTFNIHHIETRDMTFITTDPTEAIHWKRNNFIDHAEDIVLVTSDPNIAQQWIDSGLFDNRFSVMIIDQDTEPEQWMENIPRDAAAIYSDIPDHAEEILVKDRHVAGTVPVHLKHTAQSVTTWPHDEYNESFGQPVTVKTKLIARLALDNPD